MNIIVSPRQTTVVTYPTPTRVVEVEGQGAANAGGGAVYQRTFTNANLTIAGFLPVEHNLNLYPTAIALYDATGEIVLPDRIEALSLNAIAISLTSFTPIQGTWTIKIGG